MPRDSRPPDKMRRELYCANCGRTDRVTTGALLRFSREGWPKCCGETMAVRDGDQGEANTELDLPPLRDQDG
jgi:hypothetical protein